MNLGKVYISQSVRIANNARVKQKDDGIKRGGEFKRVRERNRSR